MPDLSVVHASSYEERSVQTYSRSQPNRGDYRMNTPEQELMHLVRDASVDELVDYIKRQEKKTKKQMLDAAIHEQNLANELFLWGKHEEPYADKPCKNTHERRSSLLRIAILGCCSSSDYKKMDRSMAPEGEDLVFAVTTFAPEWIDKWFSILGYSFTR